MVEASSVNRVAIVGGGGFAAGELLRLLWSHPSVSVEWVASDGGEGKLWHEVHRGLPHGRDRFVRFRPEAVRDVDVVLIALPPLDAASVVQRLPADTRVIDLSGAHRLDPKRFERWYGVTHPNPIACDTFVYGLPELSADDIRAATRVAVPGCFATASLLSLLPLRAVIDVAQIVGITGSSGSGARPADHTHHPIRATNLRAYKALEHQHAPEIAQFMPGVRISFVPVSAPLSRGILTTTFVNLPSSFDIDRAFVDFYGSCPFVRLQRQPERVEVAAVKGSMFADLGWSRGIDDNLNETAQTWVVTAALDNLIKGGAGQAVQCLNLMLGLDETYGLAGPALWP